MKYFLNWNLELLDTENMRTLITMLLYTLYEKSLLSKEKC